jgi:dimethylamine/trimethylamine dehydrogenase
MIKSGVVDFIGAARPAIADPFLPHKIQTGRIEEIRECIGCNICVASDNMAIPIRCTQNPTMGEEWRRGWHPEQIEPKGKETDALVVGAGPAGLECAMQLAKRGYEVTLAEGRADLGGRALLEGDLLGLSAWKWVTDHRIYDLQQRGNVKTFSQSLMTVQDINDLAISNVFIATGAKWRRDGVGRSSRRPILTDPQMTVLTPDDVMAGQLPPRGPVLIYDDDQIYLAGVLADHLSSAGYEVIFATPATKVSPWTENTLEQVRIQTKLIKSGVQLKLGKTLKQINADNTRLACIYSEIEQNVEMASILLVTERRRNTELFDALDEHLEYNPLNKLKLIGDAEAPGLIADAIFSGHMAARHFEKSESKIEQEYFRREIVALEGN